MQQSLRLLFSLSVSCACIPIRDVICFVFCWLKSRLYFL
ncbi:hypothetical protein SPAB_04427 [Salmonella enterica subsp. enterica serovar Paratyphi B str. SPB7]|uniref:Uncharacterized protein n=1 Tax=Salmonella paratyphi B (strain ATCC BAA-1250 / SPB7) TaxID=1016998 RepID=A0A6C6Z723_SALPB|nr:hypothetical protein SPAB_04427 [Salmonella enterica subsp. enterica serovar Paratyphi B str. SPB7]